MSNTLFQEAMDVFEALESDLNSSLLTISVFSFLHLVDGSKSPLAELLQGTK
jgi:hypothetical protein